MSVPLRFLVAEDDPFIREFYRENLHRRWPDAEIRGVVSEAEAVLEGTADRLDLIVMDGSLMPGTGVAAVQQIRAAGVSCPILFVSGAGGGTLREALDAGATLARCKPVPVHEFIVLVDKLLNP